MRGSKVVVGVSVQIFMQNLDLPLLLRHTRWRPSRCFVSFKHSDSPPGPHRFKADCSTPAEAHHTSTRSCCEQRPTQVQAAAKELSPCPVWPWRPLRASGISFYSGTNANKHEVTHRMCMSCKENKPHNNGVYFVPGASEINLRFFGQISLMDNSRENGPRLNSAFQWREGPG